jgi:hypothetical protein
VGDISQCLCAPGYEYFDQCTPCQAGFFKDIYNNSNCTLCPTAALEAATECPPEPESLISLTVVIAISLASVFAMAATGAVSAFTWYPALTMFGADSTQAFAGLLQTNRKVPKYL